MSDDKTQEMPVMADAGDMPTETLHTVDAQSTYDQSQRSGRATQMISRAWNPLQRKAFRPIPLR